MKDKFNDLMERNEIVIKNIVVIGDVLNKLIFGIAIAVITIYISITANNISKTANSLTEVSNNISKQNLELNQKRGAPVFLFKVLEQDGINKYQMELKEGSAKDVSMNLKITVLIRNKTKNMAFNSTLYSYELGSESDNKWVLKGENLDFDLNKYVVDIENELMQRFEGDSFLLMRSKVISVSFRDYNNNYLTEYYTINDNNIKFDSERTKNNGAYSLENEYTASVNSLIKPDMENKSDNNQEYKSKVTGLVDFTEDVSTGDFKNKITK